MAVYQALLLNTVVPQIQAAQAGDSYVMVVNATTPALRITQTGTGNALEVEDSANPDATPFVVSAAGDVGIGASSPGSKLDVLGGVSSTSDWGNVNITSRNAINSANRIYAGLRFQDSGASDAGAIGYSYNGTGYNMFFGTVASVGGAVTTRLAITSTGEFQWKPDGTTQAMTLDASGNLGVGTSSPVSALGFGQAASATGITFQSTSTTFNSGKTAVIKASIPGSGNGSLIFETYEGGSGGGERARITSGGEFLVGTNAAAVTSKLDVLQTTAATAGIGCKATNSNAQCFVAWNSDTSGDNVFAQFYTETSATSRGSITYNRAGGLVAYNTTSDYRAKDIIGPVANAGVTIDALKVYNGKMKGATVERPMLIAHEAQAVTPYAVTGEKDAVNDDGTPKYQQMDVSSLVPLLIAEIQSLRARVAQLEAK